MSRRASFASRISSLSRKIKIFNFVRETKISISNKLHMVEDLGLSAFANSSPLKLRRTGAMADEIGFVFAFFSGGNTFIILCYSWGYVHFFLSEIGFVLHKNSW